MRAPGRAVGAHRVAAVAVRCGAHDDRGLAGRRRIGGGIDHVSDNAGDVVRAAAADGELDQLDDRVVPVGKGDQGLVQGLLGDDIGQPVGAEHVPVAQPDLEDRQVRLSLGPAVKRPQQQRPLRMGGGRLRGQPAVVHQRLDQRVVAGDLMEIAVA